MANISYSIIQFFINANFYINIQGEVPLDKKRYC